MVASGLGPGARMALYFLLELAEMSKEGFPALARYRLSESSAGPIVISAYLGNPIVLSEHHTGVAGGLELLS